MSDIKAILASINKKYGDNTINYVSSMKHIEVERISSGSSSLDYILGGNKGKFGWPFGRCVELYGHPSSGKSLISLLTIKEAQKNNIDCIYFDAESGFDPEFAQKLGIDINKLIVSQISVGENLIDILTELLQSPEKKVIVVDSIASMISNKEMEESIEQQNIALKARLMSRALAKITALNKSALIIFINQVRINVGAYGNPETTTGGKALGHYASIRVEVRMGEPLKEKDKQIGQVVKFKVKKNKTANPFGDGYFKFYYDGSIDKIDELVTLGLLNRTIKQEGAMYEIAGKKVRGREELESQLKDDTKFFEQVKKEILK